MADLDGDGFEDIISVHESDDVYDGAAEGHVRIAFGSEDPQHWERVTLAQGAQAGAAEDVTVADIKTARAAMNSSSGPTRSHWKRRTRMRRI